MNSLPPAKKSLGQHWLTDEAALDGIIEAADLTQDDTVLEIGPGTGSLTHKLCAVAGCVIAVELDNSFARKLASQKIPNLQVIESDILRFDLTSLPPDYKVVANIPYYLTGNLLRMLSDSSNPASRIVLLVQKEVAERVAARPGGMSLLSVSAQFYWHVSLGAVVPAKFFTPPPKVDSQILILKSRSELLLSDTGTKAFFKLVKAGFAARRKTLINSLAGGLRMEKAQIQVVLDEAQIASELRPQALSLRDWNRLYVASVKAKIL